MKSIEIFQSEEFQKTLTKCIQRSIDRCIECDGTYNEDYLDLKWTKRILDYWKPNSTFEIMMPIIENAFAF